VHSRTFVYVCVVVCARARVRMCLCVCVCQSRVTITGSIFVERVEQRIGAFGFLVLKLECKKSLGKYA